MKHIVERLFFTLILIHLPFTDYAQKFDFKNYTVKNGLGSSIINNIFQDSKGYIWFATQGGGISRFNGKEFKTFTKVEGLVSNDVTVITEDKKGNIWIGTAEGASEFDGIKFRNFGQKEGLSDAVVYDIYVDNGNKVWFALYGRGIKIFDGIKFDSLTTKNGLSSNKVYSIIQDKSGIYWFGLANGIAKYDGKQITSYSNLSNIHRKTFFSSMVDTAGNVWFGSTTGDVIIKSPADKFENLTLPTEVKNDFIGSIAHDKNGNIWLATDHGVLKYKDNNFTIYSEREGLSVNSVLSVTCDYEDNLWIGTNGGGVIFFRNEAFSHYTGLLSDNIDCIIEDTLNKIYYVGTANGLYILNPKSTPKFQTVNGIKGIEKINISSLSIDKKGLIWISAQEGVFVLEKMGNTFRLKKKYNKIGKKDIISPLKIIHDSKGNCWVATFGSGLLFINEKKEKLYTIKNGFPSDKILTLFEDNKSTIWIGTQDAGVFIYDGAEFKNFKPQGGFPDKAVWSITGDAKGNMYFGTNENGLCCYDGKKIFIYTTKEGLCSNNVSSLQWDKYENCLWLGAEKGLNKIIFKNNLNIESIRNYKEQDGFNSSGINQNAILTDDDGLVWIGTINGLWCYNKKYDIFQSPPPKIQLTGIRLAYQKVDWKNFADSINPRTNLPVNLELSYKNNHLVFDVQALTTEDVFYTFKMEGLDDEWSPLTKNNEINYANIPPGGKYTFKAKAININGNSSSDTILFNFSVNPPWWNTWWFRIALFLVVFSLIAAFIKGRERILKEQNLKLERTVVQRTSEVVHQKEIVEEKNKSIIIEKERSESLLLNILPAEVAEELKDKGVSEAKLFDDVTVLFTDFKGFTTISERVSPQQLVSELHECFKAFDEIIGKYNIEKIKTVGDAYLAAAGVPAPNPNHAIDIVSAAIEMRDFMLNRRKQLREGTFEMRAGINSGHVVAGIVGVKKFAYDIWGDTVNIAARMEQNGEIGRVNISETTYELVKDKFTCTHRGKIDAKNKGMIDMYFVEGVAVKPST